MGTRGAFWINHPADLDNRRWLGCIAFDAFPDNFRLLATIRTEEEYIKEIERIAQARDDFAHPGADWPFPWDGDVFLTDVTYVFMPKRRTLLDRVLGRTRGEVYATWFHAPLIPLRVLLKYSGDGERDDPSLEGIRALEKYNRTQPDSIIIIGGRK